MSELHLRSVVGVGEVFSYCLAWHCVSGKQIPEATSYCLLPQGSVGVVVNVVVGVEVVEVEVVEVVEVEVVVVEVVVVVAEVAE